MLKTKQKTTTPESSGGAWKKIVANKHIYIMLIPVVAYYIIFHYVPMYGLSLAFRSFKPGGIWNMLFEGKWMGMKYFEQLFSDPLFYRAVRNTFIINGQRILILFPFTIIIVLMLNELKLMKFKKISQTITYLPHFFSWVIIGGIIIQLLTTNGAVTNMLEFITGKDDISLLTSTKAFRWIILFSTAFKETGWDTIIYLSALSGISAEFYEAAECDGINRLQAVWYITLPCIMPTICIMLLMKISHIIQGSFDQIYVMYNTAVYEVADIIETYTYRIGISEGKFGMSTAVGLIKSIASALMLIVSNTLCKKITGQGMY